MRGKKFVAWALSAIMALAPLSSCAQQPAGGGEVGDQVEEMDRDIESTDGKVISVDANDEGTYAVTITEDNLIEEQDIAEKVDEVVTAGEAGVEEEMTRDAADAAEEAQPAEAAEPAEGAGCPLRPSPPSRPSPRTGPSPPSRPSPPSGASRP